MKTLVLMRHAKAEPAGPDQSDFDRPLAARGRKDAVLLGDWLRRRGHVPTHAIVSPALRTRETWDRIALDCATDHPTALYDASVATILRLIGAEGTGACLAVTGHNPGLGDAMLNLLRAERVPADLAAVPTGATAIIGFEGVDWAQAIQRPGRLIDWTVPRKLRAAGDD
ncbi:histidine phosphatase family protein [Halovulum dunhuangense]|uniref:Histidine phosphatase family protein n=1 Tax=Halovulum dunhuangense TaxID=1505036 RepID=A0A849L0M7_9RHOB|nr:histidine phosphatase family protein [Halovulum dunhuangense]NNU79813.1 histidine phosphatase family protein [Halovulum dunhuangense]